MLYLTMFISNGKGKGKRVPVQTMKAHMGTEV